MKLAPIVLITSAILAAGATGATAATTGVISHIFGHGGKHYVLDAVCHRPNFPPPGISDHEGLNVVGQQVHCLVRRKAKSDQCIKQLGPVPAVTGKFDHGPGKPGDWSDVDLLRNYVASLQACVTTK
jgi:hypothetical protein